MIWLGAFKVVGVVCAPGGGDADAACGDGALHVENGVANVGGFRRACLEETARILQWKGFGFVLSAIFLGDDHIEEGM